MTFVSVSKLTARVEVEDVVAAVRPNTCLVSIMLANNETGVIMVRKSGEALNSLGCLPLTLLIPGLFADMFLDLFLNTNN